MEVQTCAFESPAITNSDYYYGQINIGSVIMCFLIIYSTALSIVLSVKQLIQVIKEEELIMEMEEEEEEEEEEKVDVQTQVTKEEEEVIVKEVVKVDVQTQVNKEEEEEKERKEKEQKREEELLLANYNAKERALALQTAYDERANLAFEKWRDTHDRLNTIQSKRFELLRQGYWSNDYSGFLTRIREEYLETNEKLTRAEAFNALKKTNLLGELPKAHEFAHLFNS